MEPEIEAIVQSMNAKVDDTVQMAAVLGIEIPPEHVARAKNHNLRVAGLYPELVRRNYHGDYPSTPAEKAAEMAAYGRLMKESPEEVASMIFITECRLHMIMNMAREPVIGRC